MDPLHGDDTLATQLNPRTDLDGTRPIPWDTARMPLADYPPNLIIPAAQFPDPNLLSPPPGVLQHAPYAFRTLTGGITGGVNTAGSNGAIAYILRNFPSGPPASLPWTNQSTQRRVRWIIIHLLPGLYGPDSTINPGLSDLDPASGLRFNGEAFPVTLPTGVSLQGTSALDTILDARNLTTAIIETNGNPRGRLATPGFEDYGIDSLTIRNARANGSSTQQIFDLNITGAGVWFGWENPVQFTVSNCFLVDNDVGIALEDDPSPTPNSPTIVNNTLAWNRIGIWNGYRDPSVGVNQGNMMPVILNNVIDTCNPADQLRVDIVTQGMHQDDLRITALADAGGNPVTPPTTTPNAWSTNPVLINTPTPDLTVLATWPTPNPRPTPTPGPLPSPVVDLAPFMATPTKARGLLYVMDALRLNGGGSLSPHDLRLAPHTAADASTISPTNPISQTNPLVSRGLATGDTVNRFQSITYANGFILTDQPGIRLSSTSTELDEYHAWDWDCEGFGNPRIRCRTGFPVPPAVLSPVDLGADEMDELIVAGYIESTRIFGTVMSAAGFPVRHQARVHFLDLRGPTYPRPSYLTTVGWAFNWWQHVRFRTPAEGCLDCTTITWPGTSGPITFGSNYTDAATPFPGSPPAQTYRNFKISLSPAAPHWPSDVLTPVSQPNKAPIMRSLQCDFAPVLFSDLQPYWGEVWFHLVGNLFPSLASLPLLVGDVYASNPWQGSRWSALEFFSSSVPGMVAIDNWTTYSNPAHPTFPSQVGVGVLHPPGSFLNGLRVECGPLNYYLHPTLSTAPFGAWAPCTGGTNYTVDHFGMGDAATGCPDLLPYVPALDGKGVRFNLQRFGPLLGSNLQTFLVMLVVVNEEEGSFRTGTGRTNIAPRYVGLRLEREQLLTPSITRADFLRSIIHQFEGRLGDRR
ncbi:MAG: hypothetical protein AB7I19_07755 [Planctomycetota bacterium]